MVALEEEQRVEVRTWRRHATCLTPDVDPAWFFVFPTGYTPSLPKRAKGVAALILEERDRASLALALCSVCAVRQPCLELALETRDFEGIWGGTTPTERRVLTRHQHQV